jgi:hypothetical protein
MPERRRQIPLTCRDGLFHGKCYACDARLVLVVESCVFHLEEANSHRPHLCPVGEFPTAGDVRWWREGQKRTEPTPHLT